MSAVMRPRCAVCHRHPREPLSARCRNCGPGRIKTPKPPAGPPGPAGQPQRPLQTTQPGPDAPQDGVRN
jgi:hypothetical protein